MSGESSRRSNPLARLSATDGRNLVCLKKNLRICASSTGLTLEALNVVSETFRSSMLKRSL